MVTNFCGGSNIKIEATKLFDQKLFIIRTIDIPRVDAGTLERKRHTFNGKVRFTAAFSLCRKTQLGTQPTIKRRSKIRLQ